MKDLSYTYESVLNVFYTNFFPSLRIKKNVDGWEEAVLVSPDMGGAKRCAWLASELCLDFALIHKERKKANEIERKVDFLHLNI